MRSASINVLVMIACLVVLMNLLMTSAYTARPPQGADAMGLVIPLYGSIIGALCFLAATWLAVSGGRLAWIDARPAVATTIAMLVALGIALLLVCVFFAWADNRLRWIAPVGMAGAGIAPFVLAAVLMLSRAATAGQPALPPIPRGLAILLVPIAFGGLGLGAFLLVGALRVSAERAASTAASNAASEAEWARIRNRTPVDAAREDMAAMSPTAPLWAVVGSLPESDNAEARTIIIQRATQVPDIDAELAQTLVSRFPRYRYASLLFIQYLDAGQRKQEWGSLVEQSIDTTAADIATHAQWFEPSETENPNPVGLVHTMHAVAALFPQHAGMTKALERLTATITAQPPGAARDSALARR